MAENHETLSLEDKLYRTKYEPDTAHSHIEVDQEKLRQSGLNKVLPKLCPAEVYKVDPTNEEDIVVSHENCLECGSCRMLDKEGAITWTYPDGGMGVKYKHG